MKLFQENFELDKDELKRKLLFKINNNVNENMELISLKL